VGGDALILSEFLRQPDFQKGKTLFGFTRQFRIDPHLVLEKRPHGFDVSLQRSTTVLDRVPFSR
jgi:hypothetical protein